MISPLPIRVMKRSARTTRRFLLIKVLKSKETPKALVRLILVIPDLAYVAPTSGSNFSCLLPSRG